MSNYNALLVDKAIYHNYNVVKTIECGIVLTGQETKSIKTRNANLKGGRVYFDNGEVYVSGIHVSPCKTYTSDLSVHNMDRVKKLLVHKKEIREMIAWCDGIGKTIVPISVGSVDNGKIKVVIGLCVGLKKYDKREKEKEKTIKREMEREKY